MIKHVNGYWAFLIFLFVAPTVVQSQESHSASTDGDHQSVGITTPREPYLHPSAYAAGISTQQVEGTAWAILEKGLHDSKVANRIAAVDALTTMGANSRAITLARSALSDNDPAVRIEAINRLSDMGVRDVVPEMKALLQDKSPEVVFAAARALASFGTTDGRDVLIEVVTGERKVSSGLVRSGVAWARQGGGSPFTLAMIGASEAASLLLAPYASVGVVAMKELLTDHHGPDRAISAESLGSDGSERVVKVLVQALRDKNWTVRAAAADALGRSGARNTVADLMPLLRDKKPTVRYMAASSIIRLQNPTANTALNLQP